MIDIKVSTKAVLVLSLHAFVIWLGCGLTVALGRQMFSLGTTLTLHAIVAPTLAVMVSVPYFKHCRVTRPFATAAFFASFIIILDAAVVAPIFEKSHAMFSSILGTWFPFFLSL
jgi:hypothetical protein